MFGPVQTSGCAFTMARYSSSTSLSRTVCTKPSMPARNRSLASSSADVRPRWASTCWPLAWASSMIARYTFGCELRHGAVAIVDPDLHELHASRVQLSNVVAGPRLRSPRRTESPERASLGGPAIGVAAIPFPTVRKRAAFGITSSRS